MEQQHNLITLQGTVESISFRADSGFTVAELEYGNELVTIVGELTDVAQGEELTLTGYYVTHPRYGSQFKVMMFERRLPATASAICKYLGSGIIKGIGPAMARRMVEKFEDKTLEIIEHSPERLAEVNGISKKKAEQIATDFQRIFGVRTLMMYLSKYGITPSESIMIWKTWGDI